MTSDTNEKGNYEFQQMLGMHAIWTKSSVFTDFSIKISANKLLDDLRLSTRGKKLAAKIYCEGLDKFVCRGFKYEFLGFV